MKTLDELVRDLTTVGHHPKSEVRTKIKEFILSLMESVKFEDRMPEPADPNNQIDVGHVIGWNQYHDGQEAKIAEELRRRGLK